MAPPLIRSAEPRATLCPRSASVAVMLFIVSKMAAPAAFRGEIGMFSPHFSSTLSAGPGLHFEAIDLTRRLFGHNDRGDIDELIFGELSELIAVDESKWQRVVLLKRY